MLDTLTFMKIIEAQDFSYEKNPLNFVKRLEIFII